MKVEYTDIWVKRFAGNFVVIPVNEFVKKDGSAVMGKGLALQASHMYPKLPFDLGERIKKYGSRVFVFLDYGIVTFPTKHHWSEKADIGLIRTSAIQLTVLVDAMGLSRIYIPMVGCGNGKLKWSEVRKVVKPIFYDDRYIIVKQIGGEK